MIKYYFTIIFLFRLGFGIAQDPAFSQFYIQRMYLNPALIGLDQGSSIAAISRVQWHLLDKGFFTNSASFESRNDCLVRHGGFAMGLSTGSTNEGFSRYTRTDVGLGLNVLFGGDALNVNVGMTSRFRTESVRTNGLVFSDQLDPINPIAGPSNFNVNYLTPRSLGDVDAGVVCRLGGFSNTRKRSILGISLHNMLSLWGANHNSFLDAGGSGTAPRISIHGGFEHSPTKYIRGRRQNYAIQYLFKIESQGKTPWLLDKSLVQSDFGIYLQSKIAYAGVSYQHRSLLPFSNQHVRTINVAVGYSNIGFIDSHKILIGLNYGINSSALGTSIGNTIELGMRYSFTGQACWGMNKRKGSSKILDCYDFF